jgi:ABC-type iron transport system FetAB ATPase subunit
LQKIAEKIQRFAKFCKKLQKKYASLHNFSPSVSLLIDAFSAHLADLQKYPNPVMGQIVKKRRFVATWITSDNDLATNSAKNPLKVQLF